MSTRSAFINPLGLWMLGGGLLLAGAAIVGPTGPWSGKGQLFAAMGVLAWVVTIAVILWPRAIDRELRMVRDLRASMASRLANQETSDRPGTASPITVALAD